MIFILRVSHRSCIIILGVGISVSIRFARSASANFLQGMKLRPLIRGSNFTTDGCVTPGSRSRLIFLKGSPTRITRTLVGILIRQFRPTDTITVFGPRLSEPQILDKETPASEPLKPSV